jgi:hypothetical protein
MNVQQSDLSDPALVTEVDLARAAAQEEAGDERVGEYVDYHVEDEAAVTHHFEADKTGYGGWRWAVTITSAGPDTDITVSEVVLLPGPDALVAPDWVPWQERVMAGDLGVGDLLPTSPDDPRLVAAYVGSDDPAVEETAMELGLGRMRVMSRPARVEAAERWHESEFGPRSDMARSAPAHCGTCGFYLPLAGSLSAAFGTCGNELSPADAHVVHVEYGCGAHSEAEVEQVSPVLVADLIYDDAQLDVEPLTVVDEIPPPVLSKTKAEPTEPEPPAEASTTIAESQPATAEENTATIEPEDVATEVVERAASAEPVTAESEGVTTEELPPVSVATTETTVESEDVAAEPVASEPAVADEATSTVEAGEAAVVPEPATVEEAAAGVESGDAPAEVIAPPESATVAETTAGEIAPAETPDETSAPPVSAELALPAEPTTPAETAPDASSVAAAPSAPPAETFSPAPSVEGVPSVSSEIPAVEASVVRRRQPVSPSMEEPVGPSIPSPLRPTIEQPRGLGPRRMPRLSAIFPDGLIRRRNFGPSEDE